MNILFKERKILILLTILFFSVGIPTKSYAAIGRYCAAYIYMDYVDSTSVGIRYKVYLTLYQKCGNPFLGHNATEQICWSSSSCFLSLGSKSKNIGVVD